MLRFNESPTNPVKKKGIGQLSAQQGIPETPNTLAWYKQKIRMLPQNLKAWKPSFSLRANANHKHVAELEQWSMPLAHYKAAITTLEDENILHLHILGYLTVYMTDKCISICPFFRGYFHLQREHHMVETKQSMQNVATLLAC